MVNKNEKLMRKLSKKQRRILEPVFEQIESGNLNGLNVKKLTGKEEYRIRKGNFRIIVSIGSDSEVRLDEFRIKNENTYKR